MYNIICILTTLPYIHTNLFFYKKVQEVKFSKVFPYMIKSYSVLCCDSSTAELFFWAPQQSQVFIFGV